MSKLNEAKSLVDDLKKKAAEESKLLAEKQSEADAALREITVSMQVRSTGGLAINNDNNFVSISSPCPHRFLCTIILVIFTFKMSVVAGHPLECWAY